MNTQNQTSAADLLIERLEDAGTKTFEQIEAYGWERAYTLGRARVIVKLEEVKSGPAWVGVTVIDCDGRGLELSRATFTNVTLGNMQRVEDWIQDAI